MTWRDQANCLGHDPQTFYRHEEHGGSRTVREQTAQAAFDLCAACPVRQACLDDELDRGGTQHGIRGGMWAATRTAIILERKRAGAA